MRNVRILAVLATVALAAAGCKGDKGDPGAAGNDGSNGSGFNALVAVDGAPAANCADGGSRIRVGLDANSNGVLDASEVNASATTYVCNGTPGAAGASGTSGTNGAVSLVATSVEPGGSNCLNGGIKILSGLDSPPANGVLDPAEVTSTSYTCNGAGGLVGPAGPTGPAGVSTATTGLNVTVLSVGTTAPIAVRFTMRDDRGYPIDVQGVYSLNLPMSGATGQGPAVRFALAYVPTDATGTLPYVVRTVSGTPPAPTALSGTITGATPTVVQNAPGDYTYTFPSSVTYDAASLTNGNTYTLWIQAARQMNPDDNTDPKTFIAKNVEYSYVPSGATAPVKRELVTTAACNKCHRGFSPEGSTGNAFHVGGRVEAPFCNVCHNPARANPNADANVFVHRIHNSRALQTAFTTSGTATSGTQGVTTCSSAAPCTCTVANPCTTATGNLFHEIEITYPQDVRNCNTCHGDAAQGAQAFSRASTKACGSCHDMVNFGTPVAYPDCAHPPGKDVAGVNLLCNHTGGPQTDADCASCHNAAHVQSYHVTVVPPDPNNVYLGGTNGNTHAAWMAAAGQVPAGASVLRYVLPANAVSLFTDSGGVRRPRIVFKVTRDGADVDFGTYDAATKPEMIADFVGSPSAYFAYAVPQDGVATPADFNVTAGAYLKNIWKGTATSTSAGTLTRDAVTGFYTATLTGVVVPPNATMFTGGIGYTYSLGSATNSPPFANNAQPFTQTNVAGFSYLANTCSGTNNYCGGTGGLIVPIPNEWQTLSVSAGTSSVGMGGSGGNTACTAAAPCPCTATNPCFPTGARRAIVDKLKCRDCHAPLGVAPSFHAGQRNDGPSCSFCHNPNRTSAAWSANGKDAIHAIHGARKRAAAYAWHAITPTENFSEVTFPGALNNCTACHLADTFDFSATASARALPNLLWSTVGQGRYDSRSASNPSSWFTISPYVTSDSSVDYGYGFATSNVTYTLPDGLSGTQGANVCSPASPCVCTAANPCSVTVGTSYTVYNQPVSFRYNVTGGATCTDASPCTCVTNPASGPATNCTTTVATCTTSAPCAAQGTTLVKSPITSACSACHDTNLAIDHMQAMGGYFYAPRASSMGPSDGLNGPAVEQCMLCHAKGKLAAIREVHK